MSILASLVFLAALEPLQDDAGAKIQELVRQLGADDYATREKATQELRKIGKPAEEALRKAAQSSEDPEVRERSRGLLEALAEGEKPKSDGKREAERGTPAPPPFGFRGLGAGSGSSVQIQTVNGDSTYRITPGDGSPALTFRRTQAGPVKLEYTDEKGEAKTVPSDTLEKFLEDHKDLAKKFGITEEGIEYSGARVSFKGGLRALRAPRPFRVPSPVPPGKEEEQERPELSEATDALRAQLALPAGQGVVVNRVPAGSPGEALGLRKNDILLEVSGRAVGDPERARELLRSAATARVLRKGEKITLAAKKDF
jgi:hypothetical protein